MDIPEILASSGAHSLIKLRQVILLDGIERISVSHSLPEFLADFFCLPDLLFHKVTGFIIKPH